jgi:hypothetical protein
VAVAELARAPYERVVGECVHASPGLGYGVQDAGHSLPSICPLSGCNAVSGTGTPDGGVSFGWCMLALMMRLPVSSAMPRR